MSQPATTDAQVAIWEKQIAQTRRLLRISYPAAQREEYEETIARLETAIAERRAWLAAHQVEV